MKAPDQVLALAKDFLDSKFDIRKLEKTILMWQLH